MDAGSTLFSNNIISCFIEVSGSLEFPQLLACRLSVMEYLIDRIFSYGLYTFEDIKAHTYHRFEVIPTNFLHRVIDFAV
jgi:hypothetical protein